MSKNLIVTKSKNVNASRSVRGDFFKTKNGRIDLQDGTTFSGKIPEWQTGTFVGEVVFNTGMTGYVESLTDPSYTGEILVFTFPLIGNYGVNELSSESGKIQVSGVVVSEAALMPSHGNSGQALLDWLRSQNIPVILDVDTRALTKHLRTVGTMLGAISTTRTKPKDMKLEQKFVSIEEPIIYNPDGKKKIVLVDCGAKENIVRNLLKSTHQIKRVPFDYDYTKEDYDGVFLSNGPGDPTDYIPTVNILKQALKKGKPVFGICLGSQLMGLAAGAKTYKLKFGHRGHNQPCLESESNLGYITSQNHGYAIDEKSLPSGWIVSFRNLNDGSVEGIKHKTKPFFSVQFHPEACPGPTDTQWLFDKFEETL